MFTGIVSAAGRVLRMRDNTLELRADLPVRLGDSVAVNGVCLTVARRAGKGASRRLGFDASGETLRLTTLGSLGAGEAVNIEPALRAGDPLGGHIVTGHVDGRGKVLLREKLRDGCLRLRVSLPPALDALVALKGSIAVDGVSLTVTAVGPRWFETVLVPHTLKETTLGARRVGAPVNLEADPLARYCRAAAAALAAPGSRRR